MRRLEIEKPKARKKILPLVMAIANKLITQIGLVEKINRTVKWDRSHWEISPGGLAKALVLSTFTDMRVPLSHIQERLEEIDVGYIVGEGSETKSVNEFNIGRALERIGQVDCDGIYETMAITAISENNIPITRLHSDTTTISFYGEYDVETMKLTEEEKEEVLRIERGYNKDGRPQCNQVVIGQITTEVGIPVVSRTLDGATSDIEWNKNAMKYLEKIMEKGFDNGIYVADSKLVTNELITSLTRPERPIMFVSRCPANFESRLERRMIDRAYEADQWNDLGQYHGGKGASRYHGVSFIENVAGHPMRLLVLRSSSLEEKAENALKKKELELKPLISGMEKKEFACYADAEKEIERFKELKPLKLFDSVCRIEKEIIEKWPRGRRSKETKPEVIEKYRVKVINVAIEAAAANQYLREESCFVIISNVTEQYSDYELLKVYKGQQVVENSFRLLKEPKLASVIYLENPYRIKALTMLLSFSLLIRAIIQYRLKDGLRRFNEENPGVIIRSGWGGRPLTNPTFKLFFEHSIHCYYVRENWDLYRFSWPNPETEEIVSPLLKLIRFTLEDLIA